MKLVAVALALAACASTAVCPRVVNPPGARGAPFLWRAQRGEGPVVWLYGTIHNASAADIPAAVWTALEGSPRFVSELGDLEPDEDQLRELAIARTGKGLDALLATDDWWELRDALRGVIREDDLKRMRPWYAMARLTAHLSPPPSPTMDVALAERAHARGIAIDHLELWQDQLAALGTSVEVTDLTQAIRSRKTVRCDLAQLLEVYLAGDQATMQRLLVVDKSGRLLVRRNQTWLPKIVSYFDNGAFIAVGLGHVLGDSGLVASLVRAGFRVTRSVH